MIVFHNVTLQRGTKVLLDRASVTINPGEKVALVGRNGAGKSSLFGLLNGALHEDSGDVTLPAAWRLALRTLRSKARCLASSWAAASTLALSIGRGRVLTPSTQVLRVWRQLGWNSPPCMATDSSGYCLPLRLMPYVPPGVRGPW